MSSEKTIENDWKKACDGVMLSLSEMGYTKGTLANYSGFYKSLLSFLTRRKLIDKPVEKKYTDVFLQFFSNASHHDVTKRFHASAIRKILEYHQKGSFDYKPKSNPVLLSASYESTLAEYREYRITAMVSMSERSENEHLRIIRKFYTACINVE